MLPGSFAPGAPEGTHAEPKEHHGEDSSQSCLAGTDRSSRVCVVLANRHAAKDDGEADKQESGDFQKKEVQHPPDGMQRNGACRPYGLQQARSTTTAGEAAQDSPDGRKLRHVGIVAGRKFGGFDGSTILAHSVREVRRSKARNAQTDKGIKQNRTSTAVDDLAWSVCRFMELRGPREPAPEAINERAR